MTELRSLAHPVGEEPVGVLVVEQEQDDRVDRDGNDDGEDNAEPDIGSDEAGEASDDADRDDDREKDARDVAALGNEDREERRDYGEDDEHSADNQEGGADSGRPRGWQSELLELLLDLLDIARRCDSCSEDEHGDRSYDPRREGNPQEDNDNGYRTWAGAHFSHGLNRIRVRRDQRFGAPKSS